jgi:hypothetical protein
LEVLAVSGMTKLEAVPILVIETPREFESAKDPTQHNKIVRKDIVGRTRDMESKA